jgi:hypothetical protein
MPGGRSDPELGQVEAGDANRCVGRELHPEPWLKGSIRVSRGIANTRFLFRFDGNSSWLPILLNRCGLSPLNGSEACPLGYFSLDLREEPVDLGDAAWGQHRPDRIFGVLTPRARGGSNLEAITPRSLNARDGNFVSDWQTGTTFAYQIQRAA